MPSKKTSKNLSVLEEFKWFLRANEPCMEAALRQLMAEARAQAGRPLKSWDELFSLLSPEDARMVSDQLLVDPDPVCFKVAAFLRGHRQAIAAGLEIMLGPDRVEKFFLPNLYAGSEKIDLWATKAAEGLCGITRDKFPMEALIVHAWTHGPRAGREQGRAGADAKKFVAYMCKKYKIKHPRK